MTRMTLTGSGAAYFAVVHTLLLPNDVLGCGLRTGRKPMRRRDFITLLSGVSAWSFAADAQETERVRLIGVLMGFAESDPAAKSLVSAFRTALTKLGWTEGS